MICCLNPDCENPVNDDRFSHCQNCKIPLVSLLSGRFKPLRVLGQGGFGRTYLAEDTHNFNTYCVLKQLLEKPGTKSAIWFEREAKQLIKLGKNNPHIPSLIAYFSESSYLFLVQEFIEGQNLADEFEKTGIWNESQVRKFLQDILPILNFIHSYDREEVINQKIVRETIVHRDIKPNNIMRCRGKNELVLIDFGLSKSLEKSILFQGTIAGTPGYAPEEQVKRGEAYPATDLFSVGVSCFYFLSGVSPDKLFYDYGFSWLKSWKRYLKQSISPELQVILDKLLKLKYYDRYQSAQQVLDDLNLSVIELHAEAQTEKFTKTVAIDAGFPGEYLGIGKILHNLGLWMTGTRDEQIQNDRDRRFPGLRNWVVKGILGLAAVAALLQQVTVDNTGSTGGTGEVTPPPVPEDIFDGLTDAELDQFIKQLAGGLTTDDGNFIRPALTIQPANDQYAAALLIDASKKYTGTITIPSSEKQVLVTVTRGNYSAIDIENLTDAELDELMVALEDGLTTDDGNFIQPALTIQPANDPFAAALLINASKKYTGTITILGTNKQVSVTVEGGNYSMIDVDNFVEPNSLTDDELKEFITRLGTDGLVTSSKQTIVALFAKDGVIVPGGTRSSMTLSGGKKVSLAFGDDGNPNDLIINSPPELSKEEFQEFITNLAIEGLTTIDGSEIYPSFAKDGVIVPNGTQASMTLSGGKKVSLAFGDDGNPNAISIK